MQRTTIAPPSPATLLAPALAGAAFVALAVSEYLFPDQATPFARPSDYIIEACFAIGALASIAAVLVLDRLHRDAPRWGIFGRIAAVVYALGNLLIGISTTTTFITGGTVHEPVFLGGIALWLLGGLLLGVALFRANLLPRLLAVAVAAGLPLTMAIGPLGPVVEGAVWIAITIVMARLRTRA